MLLIIKDFDLNIFGVYISSEIHKYFVGFKGNGETFLFNIYTIVKIIIILLRKIKLSNLYGLKRIKILFSVMNLE